jgi:UDP-N-acetyl-D-mannosaminuronic acid transferase (WecB/TagA/CpsF family)
MPSLAEMRHTKRWLAENGYPVVDENFYLAPVYRAGAIYDPALAELIEERRPEVVYLGIGGGVQERLGHYLRDNLSYRPAILCLGAALAFMTGAQVHIPRWVDRWGLGWLWRIASSPSRYGERYLRATRLAWLVFRYGVEAPPRIRTGALASR